MGANTLKLHSTNPTVDWAVVDDMRLLQIEGEPDFVQEMVALFVIEAPTLLDELRQLIAASNFAAMQRSAHTLKGSCNTIGAKRMGMLCSDLQIISKGEALQNTAAEIFAELECEFENVCKAFTEKEK